jgi:hypothetical protein
MSGKSIAASSTISTAQRELLYADSSTMVVRMPNGEMHEMPIAPSLLRDLLCSRAKKRNAARDSWQSLLGVTIRAKYGSIAGRVSQLKLRVRRLIAAEVPGVTERLMDKYGDEIRLLRETRANLRTEFMHLHLAHNGDPDPIERGLDEWACCLRELCSTFADLHRLCREHMAAQHIELFMSRLTECTKIINSAVGRVNSLPQKCSKEQVNLMIAEFDDTMQQLADIVVKMVSMVDDSRTLLPKQVVTHGTDTLELLSNKCQASLEHLSALVASSNKKE